MPPKKDFDAYKISESGNWNVAADFVKFKIMKPLYIMDELEIICEFGHADILDELTIPVDIDQKRIVAIRRLIKYLSMLIKNTIFALKKDGKEKFEKFAKRLDEIRKVLPTLYNSASDNVKKTRKIKINEKNYQKVLDNLIEIKAEINDPLNQANLIFTPSEEFDPVEFKKKLMQDAAERG